MGEIDEALREFLIESHEGLDLVDRTLFAGEDRFCGRDTVVQVFRVVHTIKGTCGFLALSRLEKVAHAGENLLCGLRDEKIAWTRDVTDALLALSEAMRGILNDVESMGEEKPGDDQPLIQTLHALATDPRPAEPSPVVEPPPATAPEPADAVEPPVPEAYAPEAYAPEPFGFPTADPYASPYSSPFEEPPAPVLPAQAVGQASAPTHSEPVDPAPSASPEAASGSAPGHDDAGRGSTIRVDVGLLDRLMNLVGELVLARNQIVQHAATREDPALVAVTQHLNMITTELQEGIMKSRMQPIGKLWDKLPRLVRDTARACEKQVRVEIEGRETELDRTILEAIKDPLTHLVRNAVDHGVELPSVRAAAGKSTMGLLRITARHESGQVSIEIADDGGGIAVERVVAKALDARLVTLEQVARMDEREKLQLIFLPGLSTADRVTTISGRGVGMDVVRANIERIGGAVEIQTRPGLGTTFRVRIPLTLAIIPALIVNSRGERYAIPQVNLLELVRLEDPSLVEDVNGSPIYRLRGSLLPLVRLDRVLGEPPLQSREGGLSDEEILRIKGAHLAWLSRLHGLLEGYDTLNVDQLSSPTECELGRWISGRGRRWAGDPGFETMRGVHVLFHKAVRDTVVAGLAHRREEAREGLRHVEEHSRALTSILDAMAARAHRRDGLNLVVLQADGRRFGLAVDGIDDTEEIVVKPLGKLLKNVSVFAGATIMGDGRVALILDVPAIAQGADVDAALRERALTAEASQRTDVRSFLVFRQGGSRRMAVPLEQVSRLEVIPRESVERSSEGEVVQYRGDILPLIRLSQIHTVHAPAADDESGGVMQVLVAARWGRQYGLVVDEILDIVEEAPDLKRQAASYAGPGLIGSAVIQRRVTDLVDLDRLIDVVCPDERGVTGGVPMGGF